VLIILHTMKNYFLVLLATTAICQTSFAYQSLITRPHQTLYGRTTCNQKYFKFHLNSLHHISARASLSHSLRYTPPVLFSSLWLRDFEDEKQDISYLPINLLGVTLRAKNILRKVTKAYIESDIRTTAKGVKLDEVLDAIDAEYKWEAVPFSVGKKVYDFSQMHSDSNTEASRIFSKILSFAVLHRLPKAVTVLLFRDLDNFSGLDSDVGKELQLMVTTFEGEESWDSVTYPRGLSLQIKRAHLQSKLQKYSLFPRTSPFTRKSNAIAASKALSEARSTPLPEKLVEKQEMEAIVMELDTKSEFAEGVDAEDLLLTFFPKENKILARLRRISSKQAQLLQAAGRAGVLSFVLLNLSLSTLTIIQRSQTLSAMPHVALVEGKVQAIKLSLHKFGKVLSSVYVGSQRTRLSRLSLVVVLAPFTNTLLRQVESRMKLSAGKALGVLTSILVTLCIGIWGIIIISDATVFAM